MEQFSQPLLQSLQSHTFVKLTISQPNDKNDDLKKVYIRRIIIKEKEHLSFTLHYTKKDIVKNYLIEEAVQMILTYLTDSFSSANLFTNEADYTYQRNKKGEYLLRKSAPTCAAPAPVQHNQAKNYIIPENAPFLFPLGITNKEGKVLANQYDKYKQINKYVEIIDSLLRETAIPSPFTIADMGCGKGYLTFALYYFLQQHYPQANAQIQGIELRADLVEKCNGIAQSLGYNDLHFVENNIEKFAAPALSMLIALHACDTATDLAIAKGIQSQANWIVTAPCCHRQIRNELKGSSSLQAVLKHGILEERQAEILTDGIRALLLEAHSYKSKVFEFISNEHTAKNLMITAVRQPTNEGAKEALDSVEAIKKEFGIKTHYLETLLTKEII